MNNKLQLINLRKLQSEINEVKLPNEKRIIISVLIEELIENASVNQDSLD